MPGRKSLPDTLKRSPQKAQRTWIKAHDSAIEQHGEGSRAHRTAPRAKRDELYERAKKHDVAGRSNMSKKELARAIARKQ